MKMLPILFTGDMVNALLREEDPKTQTRRRVKLTDSGRVKAKGSPKNWHLDDPNAVKACHYGAPGDGLWVKESYSISTHVRDKVSGRITVGGRYIADGTEFETQLTAAESVKFLAWRRKLDVHPNMFMFRSLSRITLELTSVRVERLKDISIEDAISEGVEKIPSKSPMGHWRDYSVRPEDNEGYNYFYDPVASFRSLIESIHGPGFWDTNPWLWVLGIKRVSQ